MAPIKDAKRQRFLSLLCRYPDYFIEMDGEEGSDEEEIPPKESWKRRKSLLVPFLITLF